MKETWIRVAFLGNEWSNQTVYIEKNRKIAKVCACSCTHWGYHDESEWDESEAIVSIQEALKLVSSDKKAVALIRQLM